MFEFDLDILCSGCIVVNNEIEFLFANVGCDDGEVLYNLISLNTGDRIFRNPVTLDKAKELLSRIPGNIKYRRITKRNY